MLVPVAAAVMAAGIGATALLGGFAEAADEPPPEVKPETIVDQGQFTTTFAKATDTVEKNEFGDSKRYLSLVLKVVNQSDKTVSVGIMREPGSRILPIVTSYTQSILRVRPEIKTPYGPDVSVSGSGVQSKQLQPGIPATVVIKYQLDPAAAAPKSVTVDVGSMVLDEVGLVDQTQYWHLVGEGDVDAFVPTVAAEVTLPVERGNG
ncbi:hypothetical protein Pth03_59160 [Planotetraspora thailandica]|uniref:DUF4352 domain-containing protein n=1 Tax=Planotetraspora thailandica TaxID=487172 RepID=A0A8J3V520_9ACTN|nr:hypothetical protein Pth03_59160 [Planotetraspora thailandica]